MITNFATESLYSNATVSCVYGSEGRDAGDIAWGAADRRATRVAP